MANVTLVYKPSEGTADYPTFSAGDSITVSDAEAKPLLDSGSWVKESKPKAVKAAEETKEGGE